MTASVLTVLRQCRWVHALNMAAQCEGCANDGEADYCQGAGLGVIQDGDYLCHCGHSVVMVEAPRTCECDGPEGWHCPGEDSWHWAERDEPDSPCGHCGESPVTE